MSNLMRIVRWYWLRYRWWFVRGYLHQVGIGLGWHHRPEAAECVPCGVFVCEWGEPLHFAHDGCPAEHLDDLPAHTPPDYSVQHPLRSMTCYGCNTTLEVEIGSRADRDNAVECIDCARDGSAEYGNIGGFAS